MANIKVNDIKSASADIKLAGAELFGDSESFINDLSDNELTPVVGGGTCPGFCDPGGGGGGDNPIIIMVA